MWLNFEDLGRYTFLHLIILLTDRVWSHSPNFQWPKQGHNFCTPLSFRFFESRVNRDSMTACPGKFSHWKVPLFTDFLVGTQTKSIGLVYPQFWCHPPSEELVWTIIPQTLQGGLKVDPESSVWHPSHSKVSLSLKLSRILGVFFGQNKFSWRNGQLSPRACHNYSKSYFSSD